MSKIWKYRGTLEADEKKRVKNIKDDEKLWKERRIRLR